MMYCGPILPSVDTPGAPPGVGPWFAAAGFSPPPEANLADFAMDVLSGMVPRGGDGGRVVTAARAQDDLAEAWASRSKATGAGPGTALEAADDEAKPEPEPEPRSRTSSVFVSLAESVGLDWRQPFSTKQAAYGFYYVARRSLRRRGNDFRVIVVDLGGPAPHLATDRGLVELATRTSHNGTAVVTHHILPEARQPVANKALARLGWQRRNSTNPQPIQSSVWCAAWAATSGIEVVDRLVGWSAGLSGKVLLFVN